jgi:hypothetical protein
LHGPECDRGVPEHSEPNRLLCIPFAGTQHQRDPGLPGLARTRLGVLHDDGKEIRLRQSKSVRKGARRYVHVTIPVGAPLKEALDAAARTRRSTIILTTMEGTPWTPDVFRASWGKAVKKARVVGVTFNDLRGTAVTRLALVGCTEAEIASITGHTLRDVRSILDAHYLHRDPELARKAIHKLEMGYAKRRLERFFRSPGWNMRFILEVILENLFRF